MPAAHTLLCLEHPEKITSCPTRAPLHPSSHGWRGKKPSGEQQQTTTKNASTHPPKRLGVWWRGFIMLLWHERAVLAPCMWEKTRRTRKKKKKVWWNRQRGQDHAPARPRVLKTVIWASKSSKTYRVFFYSWLCTIYALVLTKMDLNKKYAGRSTAYTPPKCRVRRGTTFCNVYIQHRILSNLSPSAQGRLLAG